MKKTISEWLQWIEAQHHTAIDLGLDRISRVYQRLGAPQLARKVITVAGTNGKGSTIAALSSLLQPMTCKVGIYTSPHLLVFNERISINGQAINDQELISSFEAVHAALGDDHLSFFEFTTLSAFVYFSKQDLDFALLEIGLGGRLDAVNLIDPDIAIITSIALDHQDWLGHDLKSIAFEKAGILRENIPFICGETVVNAYLKELASAKQCDCFIAGEQFTIHQTSQHIVWESFHPESSTNEHSKLTINQAHLPLNSIAISLQVMRLLYPDSDVDQFKESVSKATLRGRYQKVTVESGFDVIFDVAHNPASVELLNKRLSQENYTGRKVAVFSALQDKDIDSMLPLITEQFDRWYISEIANNPRSQSKEKLAEQLAAVSEDVIITPNLLGAYKQAYAELEPGDCLIVFGSFYVLAELFQNESDLKIIEGAA